MIGDVQNHLQSRRADARPSASLYWIALDLTHDEQRILAAKVDGWLELNANKIPYSVAHPGGVVFKDNIWVGNEAGQGLTCATFVTALFNELGIPFIDVDSWEIRHGDDEWAEGILEVLSPLMSPDHVIAQRGRIGSTIRVRPSDVAAAGILVNQEMEVSLKFAEVAPRAASIEAELAPI